MFTRCPKCQTPYRIDPRRVRDDQAEALCGHCSTVFNTLAFLTVTVKETETESVHLLNPRPSSEQELAVLGDIRRQRLQELDDASAAAGAPDDRCYPGFPRIPPETLYWGGGALALAVLLVYQVFAFEGKHMAQNAHLRPLLESACSLFGCTLAPFQDLEHLQIRDRTLNMAANSKSGFEFSLSFANQSRLPQAFPKLKLVLNELTGKPVAERVFQPFEYLPDWHKGMTIAIGEVVEVRLALNKPSHDVGGFTIEFQ